VSDYLLIESREPFGDSTQYELAADLARQGNDVVLFLIENGVLPARSGADNAALLATGESGVTILADSFSLKERGIPADRVSPGIHPAPLSTVVDALAEGARTLFH
jgi:hypothetical protein